MIIQKLNQKGLISPPKFLPTNTHMLVRMGSVAYGCSVDCSDEDIYGFCIPPKQDVFPHLKGEIIGFGKQKSRFEQWQQHHIKDANKEYDFCVYSIVKYFDLCMNNNPNMLDSLFVPLNCVLHMTAIGKKVRENRKLFIHKGCFHKFKGYAFSQIHKMKSKTPVKGSKRDKSIEKYGFDIKFAYHCVRLLDEVEQLLSTGEMDLQRNSSLLKAIRAGQWSQEQIIDYFNEKEFELEKLYLKSSLPYKPDVATIKELLLECLEMQYNDLNISKKPVVDIVEDLEEVVSIINGTLSKLGC